MSRNKLDMQHHVGADALEIHEPVHESVRTYVHT